MLLNFAGIKYKDVRYTMDKWGKVDKSDFEMKQLPVLEMDGEFFPQTHAILRLLGSMFGFYPSDPVEGWKVDSLVDFTNDLIS